MNHTTTSSSNDASNITGEQVHPSYIDHLFDIYEEILKKHRTENPDLYRLVELRKKQAITDDISSKDNTSKINVTIEEEKLLWTGELRGCA